MAMLLALLVACGSPDSDARLDEDNWLEGSFVDEYDLNVTDVAVELDRDLGGAAITYLDGDVEVLTVHVTGGMPEQGDELEHARMAYVVTDLLSVDDGPQDISFQWTLDGDTMTGSFESEFDGVSATGEQGDYDVAGTFSGPVSWRD